MFAPLPVEAVKLWNFVPFDRRRVTAVYPPEAEAEAEASTAEDKAEASKAKAEAEASTAEASKPSFLRTYHRFRTVRAPWTEAEGWKGRAPHKAAGDSTLDGNEHVSPGGLPFEQEKDTCAVPDELDVYVDCSGGGFDPQAVVGMGVRARWAQIGTDDGRRWWICKLKDCE